MADMATPAAIPALSGDMQGMASSNPAQNLGEEPSTISPKAAKGAARVARDPASSSAQRPPAQQSTDSGGGDVAGNPFADDTAQAAAQQQDAQTAAPTEDAAGNPFADQPSAPPPAPPGRGQVASYVKTNLAAHQAMKPAQPDVTQPPQSEAHSFLGALEAGLQISVSGLAIRGKMPDTILPEHADLAMRIANQLGTLAGDVPAMVAGMVGGAAVGGGEGAAAGSVVPGVGTAAVGISGAAVGGMAGAFALPAAVRKMYVDHYLRGDISASDNPAREFVSRLMGTAWETIKGGAVGAATAVTGGTVAPIAGKLAGLGSELVAMTTVGAAMEGRLPHPQEFLDGALLMGTLHGLGKVTGTALSGEAEAQAATSKLKNVLAATGETPSQVVDRVAKDVELRQQMIAGNAQEPPQAAPTKLVHDVVKEPGAEGQPEKVVGTKAELEPLTEKDMGIGEPPREPPGSGGGEPPAPESPEAAVQETLSKIGTTPDAPAKPWKQRFQESFDSFYAKNIDYLDPINSAIQAAIKKGADVGTSAYDLGRLFAGHMDKTRSFLEFGTRDGEGKINGEGLNQILREAPDLDRLRAYGMAAHALELDDRGVKPWGDFNRKSAQMVVDSLKEEYAPVHDRLVAFGERMLDWAAAKGRYSPEQVEAMKEANKQYSPSQRVFEPDFFTEKVPGGSKAIKAIEGSDRQIQDPILQRYKNAENLVRNVLVNEVRSTFVSNMRAGDMIAKAGETPGDFHFLQESSAQGLPGSNQIAVFENGERAVYEGEPGVIDALKRLEGDATAMDLTTRVLRGFTNAVRIGVVSNPAFGFAHFFRSQIMAAVYSKTGMIPFVHSFASLGDFMKSSETYQDWLYNGGASGSLFDLNDRYLKDNKILAADKSAPFIGKAWNAVHSVVDASEAFIKLTDNLSRFTEYKRSIEQGVDPVEAAMRSRDVVPDYSKAGLQRSVLRSGVAFIGAHINSLDRMFQEIDERPKTFVMKMGVISGMSAALWYVNHDDEAYQALPDWQKNTYWNFNVTRFTGNSSPGEATMLRLPKPWAPGILFGSGAEVALDEWFKHRPQELQHFASSLTKSVMPELLPNILQPVMDQYSNKQAFTGRPLVPEYKQKLLPEMQYSPYTSDTAKELGKMIGYVPLVRDIGPSTDPLASPDVVENYIRTWGGTLGGWALKLSDNLQKSAGVVPNVDKADPWENTAFLHQFVSRFPSFTDQRLQDFYENRDKADQAFNSAKLAAKQGNYEAAEAIKAAHPDFNVRLDRIAKGISAARKTYQNIQEDPSVPAVEKRQQLDSILFQIGSMAKEGNQMMDDFRRGPVQTTSKAGGR